MTTFINHKQAGFHYEILETFEMGIQLVGTEVKAIKKGHGRLTGSHVSFLGNEVFLIGADIPAWQINNAPVGYNPLRPRKLLLRAKEIQRLQKLKQSQGLTLIPISMYNKGDIVKISIALARGKKKHDKRESIKKRDTERDIGRKLKGR